MQVREAPYTDVSFNKKDNTMSLTPTINTAPRSVSRRKESEDIRKFLNQHLPEDKYIPISVKVNGRERLSSILLTDGFFISSYEVTAISLALRNWNPKQYASSSIQKAGRGLSVVHTT